jgi:hypothetical protein
MGHALGFGEKLVNLCTRIKNICTFFFTRHLRQPIPDGAIKAIRLMIPKQWLMK